MVHAQGAQMQNVRFCWNQLYQLYFTVQYSVTSNSLLSNSLFIWKMMYSRSVMWESMYGVAAPIFYIMILIHVSRFTAVTVETKSEYLIFIS
jgi:hypothetical protein